MSEFPVGDPRNVAGSFPAGDPRNVAGKFPAGDPRNVAGSFPAGDPRNVNASYPAGDPRNVNASYPAGDPRNVAGSFGPSSPNYDARLDPNSPKFEPAIRDRAGLGGVGDRAGADYRNAVSAASWHALNHTHDGSPYPGLHGEGPQGTGTGPYNPSHSPDGYAPGSYNPRHNPDGYAPPVSEPAPKREITEKEKAELEARKNAYLKRTSGTA